MCIFYKIFQYFSLNDNLQLNNHCTSYNNYLKSNSNKNIIHLTSYNNYSTLSNFININCKKILWSKICKLFNRLTHALNFCITNKLFYMTDNIFNFYLSNSFYSHYKCNLFNNMAHNNIHNHKLFFIKFLSNLFNNYCMILINNFDNNFYNNFLVLQQLWTLCLILD